MSKNIIITGTSSGIGFELVKIFSKKNHRVLALSRNNSKLRDLNLDNFNGVKIAAKLKPIIIAVIDTAIVIRVARNNSSPQPVSPNARSSIQTGDYT